MLVQEIMHPDPVTINPEIKLADAYKLMQDKNIRHLPVMENGKLIGIVTDRDLRLATSKLAAHPFDPSESVSSVMSHPVQTVVPNDPIGAATRLMRELKIGCLPVVEDDKLVGIITNTDILDAMMLLTGVHKPSGRIDVRMTDKPGELAKLAHLFSEKNVNIHSILSYEEENGKLRLVLRMGTIEIRPLAEAICSAGFEVLWPPHLICAK